MDIMEQMKQWFEPTANKIIAFVVSALVIVGSIYGIYEITKTNNKDYSIVMNDLIVFEYGETEFDENVLFNKVINVDESMQLDSPVVVYEKNKNYSSMVQELTSKQSDTIYFEFKEIRTDQANFGYQKRAEMVGFEKQNNKLPEYSALSAFDIQRLVVKDTNDNFETDSPYKTAILLKQGDTVLDQMDYDYYVIDSKMPVLEDVHNIEITEGEIPDFSSFKSEDGLEVQIMGDYDINIPGTYELKAVVTNKNNNTTEQPFQLVVKEKTLETLEDSWNPSYGDDSPGQGGNSSNGRPTGPGSGDWNWEGCIDEGIREVCIGSGTDFPWQINP